MNVLAKTYGYFERYKSPYVLICLLGLISTLVVQLLPQALQLFVDCVLDPALNGKEITSTSLFFFLIDGIEDFKSIILRIIILFLSMGLLREIIHYIKTNAFFHMSVYAEEKLRADVFRKMITQNTLVLSRYSSGELLTISNQDPIASKDIFCTYIPNILEAFLIIVVSTFFILRIHPLLAIMPAIAGIIMIFGSRKSLRMMRDYHSNTRTKSSELNATIQENINGVRIIRSFNSEKQEIKKFDTSSTAFRNAAIEQTWVWAKFQAFFQAVSQINGIVSIGVALYLALNGYLSKGQFATFGVYAWLIANSILNLSNWLGQFQQCAVAAGRMFVFLETSNVICDEEEAKELDKLPDVELRNASLTIDEKPILKDINLKIPYGKKLGIMGKTGAGKTSLLRLMSRFYDATSGDVEINSINIKKLKLDSVRRQFAFVFQDVFLFSNSVESNIAFFDPTAPFDEVEKTAKIAEAHDFILKMSDGYNTVVGEKGIGLSGGQKQRISIARALMKNSPILFLDDATSALDLKTEKLIFDSIKRHYPDITIVITAHRASSVEHCDEIIFLDNGQIIERGTHEELMAKNGSYAEIYNSQKTALSESLD